MSQSHSVKSTLAELATQHAAASRVFQRVGLDFCCKGRRSLDLACAERGLDAGAVLAEIERTESPPATIASESSEVLIRHIVGHYHRGARAELPLLIEMATKVERVHAEREGCPLGLAAHLRQFEEQLLAHMAKEENILFPLFASGHPRLQGPMHVMEAEHRDHAAALGRSRELTKDFVPPPSACGTWRALYLRLAEFERELMEHVHLENHVLFPRAMGGA